MKLRSTMIAVCLLSLGIAGSLHAQDASKRTQELVAALDKTKFKSKEKKGIKVEVYVDIKNEAVVKTDPSEYTGLYADDVGLDRLEIRVASDGRVEGGGVESVMEQKPLKYTLQDGRIDGALLSATRVFADGRSERFEAVFVNETTKSGTNPSNIDEEHKMFGMGYVHRIAEGTSRVFLVRK